MRQEHKTLEAWVEVPEPLLQRHVEELYKGLRAAKIDPMALSAPEYNAGLVSVAVGLGWCGIPSPLLDLRPAVITWITRKINDVLAEALTVPPE